MNTSGTNAILAIVIILTILPVCTQAIPMPHSVEGTVYLSDGVTQAPAGTNFNVTDTTSGDYKEGNIGSSGEYAAVVSGSTGDPVIIMAWNATHHGTTPVTLSSAPMTGIDVTINITSPDIIPPATVSNLGETGKGTTWILWNWTNPSDSDFSRTIVYINGVLKAEVNIPDSSHRATGLASDTNYTISTHTADTSGNVNGTWMNDTAQTLPAIHRINVTRISETLNINEFVNFNATGYDQNNTKISDLVFEWTCSDEHVGNFTRVNDNTVNFTAEHVGITYLTASSNGMTSDPAAQVTVNGEADNTNVANETIFTTTSGDANVTGNFNNNLTGWINTTAIGNATNSPEVNQSKPLSGLGLGDKVVSGVTINLSGDSNILGELEHGNGTIRIEICYNDTTLEALDIDASTLAIWKYNSSTEAWVKQSSTVSGKCVYTDVDHLCTFGLFGSKVTSDGTSGGSGGSGGRGTYPPGFFGTPTPTVTATKAPTTGDVTDAPPDERVTPRPTKVEPTVAKTATAEGTTAATTAATPKKGIPGFTAVFVIAGVLAVAYMVMRRRE